MQWPERNQPEPLCLTPRPSSHGDHGPFPQPCSVTLSGPGTRATCEFSQPCDVAGDGVLAPGAAGQVRERTRPRHSPGPGHRDSYHLDPDIPNRKPCARHHSRPPPHCQEQPASPGTPFHTQLDPIPAKPAASPTSYNRLHHTTREKADEPIADLKTACLPGRAGTSRGMSARPASGRASSSRPTGAIRAR
jgi:hypothetical protein